MGTTGIPRNPREIRGNRYSRWGYTAGIKLILPGVPRVWNLLLREIRGCVLQNVDGWGRIQVLAGAGED